MAQITAAILGANLSYVAFAFIPPVLWLLFYLREDKHPEPKLLLLLTFVGGMASAFVALAGECLWMVISSGSCSGGMGASLNPLILFGIISLIEEYSKYLPVRLLVEKKRDFDEPIDAMIYMMTSAMGFAALENLLFVFPIFSQNIFTGLEITTNRFLGANLLHALASGIVGFFIARAFFSPRRHHFVAIGIILASIFHTLFNYLILMRGIVAQGTFFLILLLATMAVMVFVDFEKLKKTNN
ncbi:MAG: PrsW family glutamic-type intramembrane protease [bacterium]|nr:PrsW family glutamic-type intramembrane protease [bacterium]